MKFNNRLAFWLLLIIPAMWVAQGVFQFTLPAEVNGALIMTWSLVVQFYFRKAPPNGPPA